MRLKVNGVEVRVVDRIEIVLDIPEDGDTLLNGVFVHVKGGPLTINNPPERIDCILIKWDSLLRMDAFVPSDHKHAPTWFGLEGPPLKETEQG